MTKNSGIPGIHEVTNDTKAFSGFPCTPGMTGMR